MEFPDVSHVRRARTDADEEPGEREFTEEHSREFSKAGTNLVKGEQAVPVAIFRKRRPEKNDLAFVEDTHRTRVEGVGAECLQADRPIRRHDRRIDVDGEKTPHAEFTAIGLSLGGAITSADLGDRVNPRSEITQQANPLGYRAGIRSGKR